MRDDIPHPEVLRGNLEADATASARPKADLLKALEQLWRLVCGRRVANVELRNLGATWPRRVADSRVDGRRRRGRDGARDGERGVGECRVGEAVAVWLGFVRRLGLGVRVRVCGLRLGRTLVCWGGS